MRRGPPNPYGKKGCPAHQEEVDRVAGDVEKRGLKPVKEYRVKTPKGRKPNRYVDVAGVDPATGQVKEFHQVGKQTGGGDPVSRERQAIDDIEKETGIKPMFHPYNK